MIWLLIAALTLGTLALLLMPMFKRDVALADRASFDLAIYKDQLKEVDSDLDRGLLTPAQADAARLEIKRRMLTAADEAEATGRPASNTGRIVAGAVMVAVVGVGSIMMYAETGAPTLPDQPFAARPAPTEDGGHAQMAEVGAMVDSLAERLRHEPDNLEGWIMLARSAKALERYGQAAEAYRRAISLGAATGEMHSGLGETLMFANDGEIVPEAVQAFQSALRADPTEPRARFYLGMALEQNGNFEGAIAVWKHLENDAPPGAPWLPGLRERITEAAAMGRIDAAAVAPLAPVPGAGGRPGSGPAAPAGPTAEQMEQIEAMVANLAERLQGTPDDAEGWTRLAQAYGVLGRHDEAKAAYVRAIALQPQNTAVRLAYADVLLDQAGPSGNIPAELPAVLREVLTIEPENPDALYFLGAVEAESGRKDEARALWNRLLGTLPENSPDRVGLQQQIDQLGG